MPAPFLLTYSDLLDRVCIATSGGATTPEQRDVRLACHEAYQHVCNWHNWLFYKRAYRVYLAAPVTTGTITYDHTGGAYERLLTFSDALSATVQAWVPYGKIIIDDVIHDVAALKSSTTVTLDSVLNPQADVAAGTTYTLYRSVYDMPYDFKGMFDPQDEDQIRLAYCRPQDWHELERSVPTQTQAWRWTVMASPDSYGAWSLRVWGYPDAAQTLDFIYQGRGRPIKLTGYETKSYTGTVAITSGTATVTGTSTQFSSDMVGAVIRVTSSTTDYPTGHADLNPWSEQKVIISVESTTSLTVDSNFSDNYSGVLFRVTDPVDVDESMSNFVIAEAVKRLWTYRGSERLGPAISIAKYEAQLAKENDSKVYGDRWQNGVMWTPWEPRSSWLPGTNIDPA